MNNARVFVAVITKPGGETGLKIRLSILDVTSLFPRQSVKKFVKKVRTVVSGEKVIEQTDSKIIKVLIV